MPVLFDSSIYISAMRRRDLRLLSRPFSEDHPVWLSSVVLKELYAGTTKQNRGLVEDMERQFSRVGRMVIPNLKDWSTTGKILAELGAQLGFEHSGRARITNDALIATSAGRLGITVLTLNERDFARLARFRRFSWQVLPTTT